MGNLATKTDDADIAMTDPIPAALAIAFASRNCDPFTDLPYPLESTRLVIRVEGKLAMAWSSRDEYSLVGDISKSVAPGDAFFSDFRPPVDKRYLVGTQQIPPSEQERVMVESPLRGLMRESEEELTKDWMTRTSVERRGSALAWFVDRVRDGKWTAVVASKNRPPVYRFKTLVCLCLVELTRNELAALNATIARYPDREMIRFDTFEYLVAMNPARITVDTGRKMRHYDSEIVFGSYADAVIGLLGS